MPDDPKRPLWMTDDQRATVGRERRRTPPDGVPILPQHEEVTGNYEGAELEAARSRRPTPERLRLLEGKHDDLRGDVATLREDFAGMRGDQKVHGVLLAELHDDMKARRSDDADAKRHTRERWTKGFGAVLAAVTSGAFLHYVVGKL